MLCTYAALTYQGINFGLRYVVLVYDLFLLFCV